ncbi:S-adenosyl-L-methionine-dependent methyltransferase [Daedalea quercina L-15889]|uniref:S-adenosyl-L-methionine-dependent methyltransferase n=1 Tax=Daedalea quercina L-15889 TaxID=1314783 RepID=A0A165LYL4_9APHY|nr:S-adenosyl-L-methionine-dependent methyltransferase [Daedalea quercina L-15889]
MPSASDRIAALRSLISLLTDASEAVIKEWKATDARGVDGLANASLPSPELFDARRILIGACNMCIDIVDDPLNRIMDINFAYTAGRALYLAVQTNIPDILENKPATEGIAVSELSRRIGAREAELGRMLRLLSTRGIFVEVRHDHFTNSHIGRVLVNNKPAQSMVLLAGMEPSFQIMQHLPAAVLDTTSARTPFQRAMGVDIGYFDYFAQDAKEEDGSLPKNPVLDIFSMAMLGYNQISSAALIADFPWASQGNATVVDVGGGMGSMTMKLAKSFPHLQLVVQDLPATIEQAKAMWQVEYAEAIDTGRVRLMEHNFFAEQPVKGADIYLLRFILHDWPDDKCIAILSRLREAMSPGSRVLVADMLIHPTSGSASLKNAPKPLPANYGLPHLNKNYMDIVMFALYGGKERTPEQFAHNAEQAGLKIEKIWECRGPLSIIEMSSSRI